MWHKNLKLQGRFWASWLPIELLVSTLQSSIMGSESAKVSYRFNFNRRVLNLIFFILFQLCSPVLNEFLSSLEQETKILGRVLRGGPTASLSQIPEDLENVKTKIQDTAIKYKVPEPETDGMNIEVRSIAF